jgi:hypothetical protein
MPADLFCFAKRQRERERERERDPHPAPSQSIDPCQRARGTPSAPTLSNGQLLTSPATNASLFECFPYVCPEPVLVKRSFLVYNGAKDAVSHGAQRLQRRVAFNSVLADELRGGQHRASVEGHRRVQCVVVSVASCWVRWVADRWGLGATQVHICLVDAHLWN